METIKKHLVGILLCLFELLVGILVLVDPVGFTTVIIVATGIGLIILGLVCVFKYGRAEPHVAAKELFLLKGLLALTAGFFCVFQSQWFLDRSAFTFLLGMSIFAAGLAKIQLSMDMCRLKNHRWYFELISAAISIICAVVVLKYAFATDTTRATFTGVSLIVEFAMDVAILIMCNMQKKEQETEEEEALEESNT